MLIDPIQLADVYLRLRGRWRAFLRRVSCIAVLESLNHETAREKLRIFVSPAEPLDAVRELWSGLCALSRAFFERLGWGWVKNLSHLGLFPPLFGESPQES
jgi:hypothetical protein